MLESPVLAELSLSLTLQGLPFASLLLLWSKRFPARETHTSLLHLTLGSTSLQAQFWYLCTLSLWFEVSACTFWTSQSQAARSRALLCIQTCRFSCQLGMFGANPWQWWAYRWSRHCEWCHSSKDKRRSSPLRSHILELGLKVYCYQLSIDQLCSLREGPMDLGIACHD